MNPRSLRFILAVALAGALMQSLPARADDYTDIWWAGPTEDGWGVNLIQSQDVIFATFFVYGPAPAKTPIWYAGSLARAGNNFTGPLYQTTGTGIGALWDPKDHSVTPVGTATFSPTSTTTGTLTYNANAASENKSIVRQTLTTIAIGGSYFGTGVIFTTGCSNSANNQRQVADVDPLVTQDTGGQLQIVLTFGPESCTLSGAYAQEGQLFRIPSAHYLCKNGSTTTLDTSAAVYEVKSTSIGIEGRWTAPSVGGGCSEDGSFAAVYP